MNTYPLLAALLLPAVYFDTRSFRIPNWLTLSGCIGGLLFAGYSAGTAGLGNSVLALLLAFMIALPFWLLGWMGAGDVKLVAAVGSVIGIPLIFYALPLIALSGFLLSLLALFRHGELNQTHARLVATFGITVGPRKLNYVPFSRESQIRMPYAVAIAVGSVIAVLMYRWSL